EGVRGQPLTRRAYRAQRPAAGDGPPLPYRHFRAGGLTRSRPQRLQQVLFHECAFFKEPSAAFPHAGGRRVQLPPRLGTSLTSHRGCPGPAASAIPVVPQQAGARPAPPLVWLRTARARRAGNHERASVPALVAHAFLALTFVGLPSICSWWLRWLHITDFDRQILLARAQVTAFTASWAISASMVRGSGTP